MFASRFLCSFTLSSYSHRYTQSISTKAVYAVFLEWPANYSLSLASVKPAVDSQVILLGHGTVTWHQGSTGVLTLLLPYLPLNCPLQWAWTLKFTNVL